MIEEDAPLVSVVMCLHNAASYVQEAVGSLLRQTHKHLQIIVVDNGSTDGGPGLVRAFDDPRVELHYAPENRLYASAWNAGFEKARGPWVAFVHADDRHHPQFVEKMLAAVQPRGLDVACCWLHAVDEHGVRDEVRGAAYEERQNHAAYDFSSWQSMKWECPFITPSQLWRGDFVARLMPFEPGLLTANYLWQLRAAARGWRGAIVTEPLVDLRLHAESLSSKADPRQYFCHWAYAHLVGFRVLVRTRSPDPVTGLSTCHRELVQVLTGSVPVNSMESLRIARASLLASGGPNPWQGIDDFMSEISPGAPDSRQDGPDLSVVLNDYSAALNGPAAASTTDSFSAACATARAAALASKLAKVSARADRLREELDRLKKKNAELQRCLDEPRGIRRLWRKLTRLLKKPPQR